MLKVFIQSSQFETPLHQVLIWQRNGVIIFISGWSFPGSIIMFVIVVVVVVVVVSTVVVAVVVVTKLKRKSYFPGEPC